MKVLITGASGLLGREVTQRGLLRGYEVYAIYKEHAVTFGNPIKLDLTDHGNILKVFSERVPDVVIHTAAYTDVEGCEINREFAWKSNAEATKNVAMASAKTNSHLIYVSTDYVFDGEKGFYSEEDNPNPISYYGITKLKGEEFVKVHGKEWCIVRASVIYGWGPVHKLNFATWLLSNLNQGKEVGVLIDQHVSPTLNTNLTEMLLEIAERRITGTIHTAGATRVCRYDFALQLASVFDLNTNLIKQTKMTETSWRAKRPKDSSLNVNKAEALLTKKPLELDTALRMMKENKR